MNANEVISNRAIEMLGGEMGSKKPSIPTITSIARNPPTTPSRRRSISPRPRRSNNTLLPALDYHAKALEEKSAAWSDIIKIGRTHLQDATPMTLGQEFSGYAAQIRLGIERVKTALPRIYALAQGGTAVGTGINCPPGFAERFAAEVAKSDRSAFRHRAPTNSRRWPPTTRLSSCPVRSMCSR